MVTSSIVAENFHSRQQIGGLNIQFRRRLQIYFAANLYQFRKPWQGSFLSLRPGSNTVLHMCQIQFNQLGSCEVRRLIRAY